MDWWDEHKENPQEKCEKEFAAFTESSQSTEARMRAVVSV